MRRSAYLKGCGQTGAGPIHEAFASPAAEPVPGKPVNKKPPEALEEMPPEEKPAGSVWIGGYWHWDSTTATTILWVSGVWRTRRPERKWIKWILEK